MPLVIGVSPRVLLAHLLEEGVDRIMKGKGLRAWTGKSITDPCVLKKELKKIREQRYVLSIDEAAESVAVVGCQVENWKGEVVAAISISGISSHFSEDKLPGLIGIVKNATCRLSQRLNAPVGDPDSARRRRG